jgi:hypothetical protein
VPTKGDAGTRTRGRSGDVAQPSASSHRTRNGSGNSSARNPNPYLGRVPERGRHDLQDLDGQDVAGLGPVDADRPGQRMHDRAVAPQYVLVGRVHRELTVDRIPRVDHDLVAGRHGQDCGDVGMPPVVAPIRLLADGPAGIDHDLVRTHEPPPPPASLERH